MRYPTLRARSVGLLAGMVFGLGLVSAQVYPPGGYPPGGYPPGSYPPGSYPPGGYPGGGSGIPIPSRNKTPKPKTDTGAMPNFRGKLKNMDAKVIWLELGDHRVLDFKRNNNTRFYKN